MKQLGKASAEAEKRLRHREWLWCRHRNGFCDLPVWRMVAEQLAMPAHQVVAFVVRLEELANAGVPRGYVGDFNAAVFGAALGMSAEDAARIYAALEHRDVGWIDQEHVPSFWERNRDDQPDQTAALRSRRSYARKQLRKSFARLAREGLLPAGDRDLIEAVLDHMPDEELFELDLERKKGRLLQAALSTSHAFSRRENVRSHARAEHTLETDAVDNSGAVPRGEAAGSAMSRAEPPGPPPTPEQWLSTEGLRIVVERMRVLPGVAGTKIQRWLREVGGGLEVLALMIDAARQQDAAGDAFEASIRAQIAQRRLDAQGPRLRLARAFGGGAA